MYKAPFKDSLDTPAKELPDRLEDLAGSSNDFGLELHPPLKPPSYFAGLTVEEGDAGDSEYAINWEGGARLDVPLGLRQLGYCATLGHMACHSFEPNIQYVWAVHPRFGRVRALRALRDLLVGEELLADYKYGLSKAPSW